MTSQPDLSIPPTTNPDTQAAYDAQKRVNAEIAGICAGQSHMRWESIAEDTAERLLGDRYEWMVMESIGQAPQIVITRMR